MGVFSLGEALPVDHKVEWIVGYAVGGLLDMPELEL